MLSVASYAHHLQWSLGTDLTFSNDYSPSTAYNASKLCNVLFVRELERRLADTRVHAYAVNPGLTRSKLRRHASALVKIATIIFGKVADHIVAL